ncbi:unnamed protein product [Prunus armeniaca]|uniref:THO complex subunitTHOC2 C-terminal domain-containing protein n=1 Tax=Prunus armeniaca TaxID=36596 RepID=A0A6J5WV81_PRUAR|nr:unnamed protein product [Prunus armeniaca]
MANVHYTENLTEDQLDAMAGQRRLFVIRQLLLVLLAITRCLALIKSTNRLRDSLLPKDESKLAIPLLLLLAQHRSVVIIDADAPYIKMVSEQFDSVMETLLQYVEFLCSAVTPTSAYAQLIPSRDDLVHQYHLDPEVAFLIYRPVMRLFKCRGSSDVFWPLDNNDTQGITSANSESEAAEHSGNLVLDVGSPSKPVTWLDLLNMLKRCCLQKPGIASPLISMRHFGVSRSMIFMSLEIVMSLKIAKQHAALKALEELSDNSSSAITKRKKDKERIQESLDRLTSELRKHEENVAFVVYFHAVLSVCQMLSIVPSYDMLLYEYEVGRFGKFLQETLKIAYYWKVHWKWSQRITKLLIQCLESTEYMEIRNALILLSKISSVFPVTRKTGVNLEKRVSKIKADEREDLKVLATGVAAALAARKSSWITDEEFGNGYLELKSAPLASKSSAGNSAATHSGSTINISQSEPIGGKVGALPSNTQNHQTQSKTRF